MLKYILTLSIMLCCVTTIYAQSKEPSSATASISGTITVNGQPVRGAIITIHSHRGNTAPSAKTDPAGSYRIATVKAGQYWVTVVAPPFAHKLEERIDGNTLTISDGENIENLNFELIRGGVITGIITGSDARPSIETSVELTKINSKGNELPFRNFNWDMMRTDDRGVYRIYGLPKGQYLVSVGIKPENNHYRMTDENRYYSKVYYGDTDDKSKAKVIEVDEGSESTNIDITLKELKKLYALHGRIIDKETGKPISGIWLSIGNLIKSKDDKFEHVSSSSCCSEQSKENGVFKFKNIFPGRYAIFYSQNRAIQRSVSSLATYYSEPVIVELNDENDSGIEVKLLRGSTISGNLHIEGAPTKIPDFSRMQIWINHSFHENDATKIYNHSGIGSEIKPDGSFSLKGIFPGRVHLYLDSGPGNSLFKIDRIEYNGRTINPKRAEEIEVISGQNIPDIRIIINPLDTLKLHGELKVINGQLPENIILSPTISKLKDENSSSNSGKFVDVRGKFTFENLSEGEYEVWLVPYLSNRDQSETYKRLMEAIGQARQIITVTSGPPQTVVLRVDLGSKE